MTDKPGGAYATKAADTDFRKKWDKEEYAERARKKDEEERERMKENEERAQRGKGPRKGRKEDLPKPTELMKRREGSLELDKNLNKMLVVQNVGGRGPGQPGFYCEACNRTYKDTSAYLDHINGRAHLRRLGQTTRIERSTLAQVRARIAYLREKTKEVSNAKAFDFNKRLAKVKAEEDARRADKKARKRAQKEETRLALANESGMEVDDEMTILMGFGGFGSTKK